ncbi:hypothetical protein EC968_007198 [Mortierella alpina]|nr:hypothetical protein EC968_007198 [Mortierella alpina]
MATPSAIPSSPSSSSPSTPFSSPPPALTAATPAAMDTTSAQAWPAPNATSSAIPAASTGPDSEATSSSAKPKRKVQDAFGNDKNMSLAALKRNFLKVKGRIVDTSKAVNMIRDIQEEKAQLEQALAQKTANVANTSNDASQLLIQARQETETLQRKLQVTESHIAEQATKSRAMEMLNTQLTEKARASDKLEAELAEARKDLAKANKDRDQANRKLSESREAVMKMEAEKMSRAKWLECEKKKWEEAQQIQVVELQDQIKELQEEVEELKENGHGDEMAVDFLEASMIKDELAEVRSELAQKNDQLKSKTTELEKTASELRAVKETMEEMKVTIEALEQNQSDDFEEVIPGEKSKGPAAATLHPGASTKDLSLSMTQPVQPPRSDLAQVASSDQMNLALRTLDDLKSQFSILSWTRDSKASEQAIATLESKVMELTKEKESLQQELLQRIMTPPTALETRVIQLTKEKDALQQELLQRIMAPAPIHLEAKVLQLTREKEALQQELVQRIMAPSAPPTRLLVEPHSTGSTVTPPNTVNARDNQREKSTDDKMLDLTGDMEIDLREPKHHQVRNQNAVHPLDLDDGSNTDWDIQGPTQPLPAPSMIKPLPRKSVTLSPTSESASSARTAPPSMFMPRSTTPKKLGKKVSAVPPPNLTSGKQANLSEAGSSKPSTRKVAKPRSTKKSASSKFDISQLEIRNISTNPFIPCISNPDIYFSVLMNSAIVHDSQPNTKLSTVATILPEKLDVLFQAVHAKAKEITPKVAAFRASRNIELDNLKEWTLEGQAPIIISESLSPGEIYIMEIIPKFLKFAIKTIIQDASQNDPKDTPSALVRIVTGVCRAQNSLDQARILGYDILREVTKRKPVLELIEAMTSIWPEVFEDPGPDASDHARVMFDTFQAIVGTIQDEVNEEQLVLAHGYESFVIKCKWPTLDEAPYVDELAEQLMATVQEPEYARTSPDVQFAHRKALELLLIQGYSWAEILEKYVKPHLIKMLGDPEKRKIALTLLAAVLRSFYEEALQCLPLREIIDGILTEEANGVVIF